MLLHPCCQMHACHQDRLHPCRPPKPRYNPQSESGLNLASIKAVNKLACGPMVCVQVADHAAHALPALPPLCKKRKRNRTLWQRQHIMQAPEHTLMALKTPGQHLRQPSHAARNDCVKHNADLMHFHGRYCPCLSGIICYGVAQSQGSL